MDLKRNGILFLGSIEHLFLTNAVSPTPISRPTQVKTQPSSPVRTSRKVSLRETSSTLRRTKKGAVAEKTVKQLLGELYSDKSYLERLLNDEGELGNDSTLYTVRTVDLVETLR